jgi:hypothetical protein
LTFPTPHTKIASEKGKIFWIDHVAELQVSDEEVAVSLRTRLSVLLGLMCVAARVAPAANVVELNIAADGTTDVTRAIQNLLDGGQTALEFPAGEYLIGALTIPGDTRLRFDPRARIKPVREELAVKGRKRPAATRRPLFTVVGDRVRLEGLRFDFTAGGTDADPVPVETLVAATNASDVTVSDFHVERSKPPRSRRWTRLQLFHAEDCRNVVLENSSATGIGDMLWAHQCANVTSRGNRMVGGASLTTFAFGSENLRHHDNWSRNVGYQCVWRGGSPDPSRKAPAVPLGTANVVRRGSRPSDASFVPHTQGVFDVLVQNNYAEYGTTLCWGNKSRQTVVQGNIARFMWDYSYGVEGGENVVFANNISVNSAVAGFASLYWGEKLVIAGNLVIVGHEPIDPQLTDHTESAYMGQFIRLHHGPPNPEDQYGAGSVVITGNEFVNELADRPSGISIEAGRDVLIAGNKIINGLIRKQDETARMKADAAPDKADEFATQDSAALPAAGAATPTRIERRVGADASRVTVMNNEFILRQPGDKPCVLINGTVSCAIVKDNVFRKETTFRTFSDAQRELEKALPRYMLFSDDDSDRRDYSNSKPAVAVAIEPFSPVFAQVQGNAIYGWKDAIAVRNTSPSNKMTFVISGNTSDGRITTDGPAERTIKTVRDNIEIPQGLMP